jgi:hypothetical protein
MSSNNKWRTNPFFANTTRARWTTALIMAVLVCGAASSGFIVGLVANPPNAPPAMAKRDEPPPPPAVPEQATPPAPSATQTADAAEPDKALADCAKQTWPYIDRTCAERLREANKTRQVRVIAADPNAAPTVVTSSVPTGPSAPKPAARAPAPTPAPATPSTAAAAAPPAPAVAEQQRLNPPAQTTGGPSVMTAVTAPLSSELQPAADPFPPAATTGSAPNPANLTQETTTPNPVMKNASDSSQAKKSTDQKRKTVRVKTVPIDRQDTWARGDEDGSTRPVVVRNGSGQTRTIVVRSANSDDGKRMTVYENGRRQNVVEPRQRRGGVVFADEPATVPQRERSGGFLSDLFNFGNRDWND